MDLFKYDNVLTINDLPKIADILTCIILLILLPIEAYFIYKKSYHIFFKSLCFSFIFSILLHVYGNVYINTIYFLHIETIVTTTIHSDVFVFFTNTANFFYTYGLCITKITLWVLCCERIYATINKRDYENTDNICIAVLLFWLPYLYGFNIKNICDVWPFFGRNYSTFCLFFEALTITLCIILYVNSRRLRTMTFDNSLQLSEKYQLNENIKISKILIPIVITCMVINVVKLYYSFGFSVTGLCLWMMCLERTLATITAKTYEKNNNKLQRLKKKKKKIQICEGDVCVRIPKNNSKKVIEERLKKAKSSGGGNIKIITQENKTLNMNYDQQSYFNFLKQAW
uniref:G-protein coupled receptors family 1 profile domain-containing protein n=1 Tax=Strongyloides stercoralis TaxID=6248 RepID=A0AAF5D702_STRER